MAEPGVVLDSSAVIALFRGEPFTPRVHHALNSGRSRMSVVNAAEVVDVLTRVYQWSPDDVVAEIEHFLATVVESVPASLELATKAGALRARAYERRATRLSIADCFCLAIAGSEDRIVTTDRTLASVARAEGYGVVTPG